ncbi:MAG: hypothetical protein GX049_13100 [Alcaligenaceae bacterium]|nr:hypothetical protein [Alcaligenaceae bacterium]
MRSSTVSRSFIISLALSSGMLAVPATVLAADGNDTFADFSVSGNLALTSQYRFRGIMQTNNKPAIQGGFDITHSSGFYIGNWNSSITWLNDSAPDVSAGIEMNFYGGYAHEFSNGITLDVGVLRYYYPGSFPSGYVSPDTTEAYVGLGYGPVTFKYSHAFTNLFGVPDSKNSQYYDLSASIPTGVWGLNLDAHVGYQRVRNLDDGSYTDWSIGFSKELGKGISAALTYVDTNAKRSVYTNSYGKYTGSAAAVFTLSAAF